MKSSQIWESVSGPIAASMWKDVLDRVASCLVDGVHYAVRRELEPILGWFGNVRKHTTPSLEWIVGIACVKKIDSYAKESNIHRSKFAGTI